MMMMSECNTITNPVISKKRGRKPIIVPLSNYESADNITNRAFHYNASDKCAAMLSEFSQTHRDLKSAKFKFEWEQWIHLPEISEVLQTESARLISTGYKGNPMDKMYFSARYYYRKKALKIPVVPSSEPELKPRKTYEQVSAAVLEEINGHILNVVFKGNIDISPENAFKLYVADRGSMEEPERTKMKKTYKNRFFLLRKKMQTNRILKNNTSDDKI